jgi:SAM-dependent methyltransferase
MNICNICGGSKFGPGPGGRLSAGKMQPRCLKCKSLERHRALRSIYEKLGMDFCRKFPKAFQFSKDPVVPANYFASYDYSIYGGYNSLDITNTGLPRESFDWVICNHVLEHIADDLSAVSEMIRITKRGGVIQLNVPGPSGMKYTIDWGYPDTSKHDHFREYGRLDFLERYSGIFDNEDYSAISCLCRDPVTDTKDYGHFLSSNKNVLNEITSLLR